jgi:hypothetical protein
VHPEEVAVVAYLYTAAVGVAQVMPGAFDALLAEVLLGVGLGTVGELEARHFDGSGLEDTVRQKRFRRLG